MKTLEVSELRSLYHDYLLEINKNWNKVGTHTDTANTWVSDTFYLWNNDDKKAYWEYLSGQRDLGEAHKTIRRLLDKVNAPENRKEYYCQRIDEFKEYIDIRLGGIDSIIDDDHIVIREVTSGTEIKKLRYICTADNISFPYNFNVLNACFGTNMTATLRQATWDSKDGCKVWFPHIARLEGGRYIAGSTEVNWKNYFEDNGDTIIQMIYPEEDVDGNGRQPELWTNPTPMHAFMKMGDKDYRYVGTFMLDYNSSTPRYQVIRRIKDGIDLSIWAAGYDTDYFEVSEIGRDVFKELYIEKNFKKQKDYITKFLSGKEETGNAEKAFLLEKKAFVEKYGLAILNKMSQEVFEGEYIPELCKEIKKLFSADYEVEALSSKLGTLNEYGQGLTKMLYYPEESINDKIRNCSWGEVLAAQIFTIYDETSFEYLYSLDEITTDKMLYALGIKLPEEVDLVQKQSWLYYWRNCDEEILTWSIYKYYQFLCFLANIKKKDVQYVPAAKPDVRKRIVAEVKKQDEEVAEDEIQDAPASFEYESKPRAREINIGNKPSKGSMVPRHADRKINALVRANYCCEIDKNHPTFKRRNSDKNYTETHHLIPLEYSGQFQYTLDTEENIVSLCSNCHNQIHYGAGAEALIKKLYEERKDALKNAGIDVTESGIEIDLEQLLHMYGF